MSRVEQVGGGNKRPVQNAAKQCVFNDVTAGGNMFFGFYSDYIDMVGDVFRRYSSKYEFVYV